MVQLEVDSKLCGYLSAHTGFSYMRQGLDYSLWAWGTSRTFSFDDMYETKKGLPSYSSTDSESDALALRAFFVGELTTGPFDHELLIGGDSQWMSSTSDSSPWNVPDTPVSIDDPVLPTPEDATGLATTGPSAGGKYKSNTDRYGIMAQYQMEVSRYLRLLAGFRSDHHEYTTGDDSYTKDEPTWRAGWTVLPLPFVAVYGNITEGKNPNWGIQDADGNEITKSRYYRQIEVGAKAKILKNLRLSIAGFSTRLENVPVALPAQPGSTTRSFELSGRIRYKGIELTAQGKILSWWDVRASYSFIDLDTKIGGQRHNLAPHTVSAATAVRLPVLKELRLGAGYRFVDRRQIGYMGTPDKRSILPAYHVVDLFIEHSLPADILAAEKWIFRLNIDNLLDEHYFQMARQVSECSAGEPRSVMFSMLWGY
jgi:iron complex outermembrane receptor protein